MRERHSSRRTGREDVDAACRSMTAPWVIERAERAQRRRGGDCRGGRRMRRGGGDAIVGGVRRRWTPMVRMKVGAGGTKQQPTL